MGGNPGYSRWSAPFYWLMEPTRLWWLALVLVLFIPEAWTRHLWVNWLASIARMLGLVAVVVLFALGAGGSPVRRSSADEVQERSPGWRMSTLVMLAVLAFFWPTPRIKELPGWLVSSEPVLVSIGLVLGTVMLYRLLWKGSGAGGKMMVSGLGAMAAAALLLFLLPGRQRSGPLFLSWLSLMAGGFLLVVLSTLLSKKALRT